MEPGLCSTRTPWDELDGFSVTLQAQHWTMNYSSNSSSSWQMELLMEFICLLVEINKQELISWEKKDLFSLPDSSASASH